MGQVHPNGPNVVRLSQRGGGQNCECGAPYYDEHEIASDTRLLQLFPQQEIIHTVQVANTAMKKVYKNILPLLIFMIIMAALLPNILFRLLPEGEGEMICRTEKVCPVVNISMDNADSGCGSGCQVKCCRKETEGHTRKCSLEFDKRKEYTKSIQNGDSVGFGEECCLPEAYTNNCKDTYVEMSGNVKNESSGAMAMRIVLVAVFPILLIFVPLGLVIKNQNDVRKAVFDAFEPWKAKGIRMEYRRPQKHSAGALYFLLPQITQMYQPYAQQIAQPVQVVQIVQQPGGVFHSQAPPGVVIAQQGAQNPKQ
jgi:hypothetical protein